MVKIAVSLALTAALLGAGAAQAQTVTAVDRSSIAAAMKAVGLEAKPSTDSTGDPMLRSSIPGAGDFAVLFYNCTNHSKCQSLQFQTSYVVTPKLSATAMNDWNANHRFGRANLDKEGDPSLAMD